jgi:endonuclease/exonuclease/phosphatase (EEP) superfamily protein YafD
MMKQILPGVVSLSLGGLAGLSLLSYIAWGFPWELLSHFRAQYLGLAIALLGLILAVSRSRWALPRPYLWAALLVVSLNAVEILPWYWDYPQRIEPSWSNLSYVRVQALPHLRVFSANVHSDNTRYDQTIAIVQAENPDLALFIEVTPDWVNQLQAGLGDRLPYRYTVYSTGMLLMSRLPLTQTKTLRTGDFSLLATFELGGQPIQFIGIHPVIPLPRAAFAQRNAAFQTLADYIQGITTPVIVMGDFNLSPWSPYYRQFIQQTHLHNASLGFGVQPSFPRLSTVRPRPGWLLPLINIPIDHCLVSRPFRVTGFGTAAHGNADHAPIVTELVLSPGSVRKGERPGN